MSVHLQREMESLNRSLLLFTDMVEQQVSLAVKSLNTRDADLAITVRSADDTIDQKEVEVEEECLKALLLYQPVAGDLRKIIATLKITNDLERIGDLAVNIAKKAEFCALAPPLDAQPDLSEMAALALQQLRNALEAMVRLNVSLAEQVRTQDAELNAMKKTLRRVIELQMSEDPSKIPVLLSLLGAVRNLERIGDHASNIAEDVIYMVEGRIVRHNSTEGAD
ncbi:MAG: phosphate signaling complex protein PhoU [Thermoguttaceae bacterium]|nr:phosphate signaling complex protein PhoU [Thermoguttaceae bacterium]